MEKKGLVSPIFYFYIHDTLYRLSRGRPVKKRIIVGRLGTCWKIPKRLCPLIVRELEMLNLIEIRSRNIVYFNRPILELDNISLLYNLVGLLPQDN